jgi:hypothetical protein
LISIVDFNLDQFFFFPQWLTPFLVLAAHTMSASSYCRLRTSMNGSWQVKGNENECIIDGIRQRRRKKQSNTRGAPWEKGNQTKTSVSAGKTKKKKKRRLTCYLLQLIAEYLMSDETMIGQQSIKKERKKNGLEGEKVMMTYLSLAECCAACGAESVGNAIDRSIGHEKAPLING